MYGKNGYYSLREILGYNAKINIVLSSRGIGKSYGTKWFLIEQDGEFMCLYRNTADMEHALATWLDDLCVKVTDREPWNRERFEWEKGKGSVQLLLDGKVKGYFRCISQVNHIKQETFPDTLNWIWWDEFIPLAYKRLAGVPSEGDALRAIIKTVDHDTTHSRESKGLKPLRVLMYANPFTWDNPVLSYFRVIPKGYGIWRVGPDIVCEMVSPPAGKKRKGKRTMDEFLGDEVNTNQGWMNQDSYVEKCPKGAMPYLSIRVRDNYYGVYRVGKGPLRHVKRIGVHIHGVTCLGSLNGLKEGETCLEKKTVNGVLGDIIQRLIFDGRYRYEDINVKFDFIRDIQGYKN